MSSYLDQPGLKKLCAHCSRLFVTDYADRIYCHIRCKRAAADRRRRVRDMAGSRTKLEGPQAVVDLDRDEIDRMANESLLTRQCKAFIATNGRKPTIAEMQEFPLTEEAESGSTRPSYIDDAMGMLARKPGGGGSAT